MGLGEGLELEIAHDKRVGPCPEDAAVVDASAVQSAVVEQEDDEAVNGCHLFHLCVSFLEQFMHFFNNYWRAAALFPIGQKVESASPSVKVAVVAESN